MNLERLVRNLNRLLAVELGLVPSGAEGIFAWQHSESIFHPMRARDDHGEPVNEYKCICGLNKRVHLPECTGIVIPAPRYVLRKLCPQLHNQWVMTIWTAPSSRHEWEKTFGSELEWPSQGYRAPVSGPNGGPIAIQPNIPPDEEVTWEFIHSMRHQRNKTKAEWDAETERGLAAAEKADESRIDDQIADACTAFGNIPGSRSTGVSLPTKEFRQNAGLIA